MANPIQQGLKRAQPWAGAGGTDRPAMANPIQQGLKPFHHPSPVPANEPAMANPIQQGLKLSRHMPTDEQISSRNG